MSFGNTDSVLRRLARGGAGGGDTGRCDLCAEPLLAGHRHLLDISADELLCACPACAVLFDDQDVGGRQYKLIRTRPRQLSGRAIDEAHWSALGIPVNLAFFVYRGVSGEVRARYPNPVGMMESAVAAEAWTQLELAVPRLSTMGSDTEGFLANRLAEPGEYWLLPLDECYRLVAIVREHWTGFSGGTEVWRQVDRFFDDLVERSGQGSNLIGE